MPTRIFAIFLRQWYILKGNPSRLFSIFYWATIDLVIWGMLTVYLHEVGGSEFNFMTFLIGAIIFAHFLERVQYGIAGSALEDIWVRNLTNLFATPLTLIEYIGGLVVTSICTTFLTLGFMAILAWALFSYSILQFGVLLLPFIAVLFLFGMALGIFALVFIIRLGPSAETIIWALPVSLAPFSGIFYPISTLPHVLQWVSRALPSSYIFEGMRKVVLSGTFDTQSLIVAAALSLVYMLVAYLMLLRYYRLALKKGLFARFLSDAF